MTARIDRDAVARELVHLLAEIDREEAALKEHTTRVKERISELRGQSKERRAILEGRTGVQIPLTAVVLAEAGKVAGRKAEAGETACPACGGTVWGVLDGRAICHECGAPHPDGKVQAATKRRHRAKAPDAPQEPTP